MVEFGGPDWELSWPRELFVQEARWLLSGTNLVRAASLKAYMWSDEVELLLDEAFAAQEPIQAFLRSPRHSFLEQLVQHAADLPEARHRRPYWPDRQHTPRQPKEPDFDTAMDGFVEVVGELEARGYFQQAFPGGCPDVPPSELPDPSAVLETHLHAASLWPLAENRRLWDEEMFFGLVEVLHDLVARPRRREWHDYGQDWHYSQFALHPGRQLYRWRVNRLLEAAMIPYRLASSGEDEGRLVSVPSDQARAELLDARGARGADDPVGHAVALFIRREASVQDRRSAVLALAGVLEERRNLLKEELLKGDEQELFRIANQFNLRHQGADQRTDYAPEFLEWLFYWYLATVDLTDKLLARRDTR